ncbi:hypothetical protein HDN1F_09980 [gamma proteobacterium HdN1]|nr:hypothetical protein HDN1F_09980 [gamma proteobacterium HdN1]
MNKKNKFARNRFIQAFACWLAAAICITASTSVMAAGISVASQCNSVAQKACSLPFPSDLFRNTNGTYNYSDDILDREVGGVVKRFPTVREQYSDNFKPSAILNKSDGFSALGPVLFELPAFPRQDIPADGAGYLLVIDMESDKQIPMVVSLSRVANPQRDFRAARPVIIGWPRSRFEFGHKYIAVLLKQPFDLAAGEITTFSPSAGMRKVLQGTAGFFVNNAYKNALAVLERNGIERESVLSLTWFTVRSESDVTTPMKTMVQTALAQDGIVTVLSTRNTLGDPEYELAALKGELSLVNFRSADGGVYPPYKRIPDPDRERVDFVLALPKWDLPAPVPVSILGHGLGSYKEANKTGFRIGDRVGMASISIDHPNHGSRVSKFGMKELNIAAAVQSPMTIMQLLGMFVQATVDHSVVAKHVRDAVPQAVANVPETVLPQKPLLDGSRTLFDGISLGAMIGTAVGAVAPDLKGAYLVNGAGSLMHIFSESAFWDDATSHVVPPNANGAELTFVLAMMQHYVDIADGNNFAQYYRNPPPGQKVRALGMHYSLGDGSMTNAATRATAELADLPLLKEVIAAEPTLRFGSDGLEDFENGFGLVQSPYGYEQAEQIKEQIKLFDPERYAELDRNNVLGRLSELGLDTGLLGSMSPELINLLGGATAFGSFSQLVDTIYEGDMEDFLTHFNRGSKEAVQKAVDWRCELFQLLPERCAIAVQKVESDQKEIIPGSPVDGGNGEIPTDKVNDLMDRALANVQVTEGSAGALDLLGLLMLVLMAWRGRQWR